MTKQTIIEALKSAQKSMKKHSPEILTGIGIAGMIATTVSAVRATPKALQLIDAREIKENRRLSNKEIVATTWKCYVPAAVIVMNDFKPWHMAYSDIMDYLHGQTMRAILEDDPEYFYEGRFTVNAWKSEKDWSRLVIDYDVGPYKWKNLSSIDNWLWDPFNFQNGVIQAALFRNIAVTTEMKEIELDAVMYGRAPVCPRFIVQSSEGRGVHVRFINRQLSIDLTKLLPEGTIQIPEFILFGDYGGTIYLWVDEGTGTVSVDFRQGRL